MVGYLDYTCSPNQSLAPRSQYTVLHIRSNSQKCGCPIQENINGLIMIGIMCFTCKHIYTCTLSPFPLQTNKCAKLVNRQIDNYSSGAVTGV